MGHHYFEFTNDKGIHVLGQTPLTRKTCKSFSLDCFFEKTFYQSVVARDFASRITRLSGTAHRYLHNQKKG